MKVTTPLIKELCISSRRYLGKGEANKNLEGGGYKQHLGLCIDRELSLKK